MIIRIVLPETNVTFKINSSDCTQNGNDLVNDLVKYSKSWFLSELAELTFGKRKNEVASADVLGPDSEGQSQDRHFMPF